jgi:2-furoyl-CoA dehydrogenase FAD binding subunit
MKPRPFTYVSPASLDEALLALEQHRDSARIIAGGLSLVPMMNFRLIDAKVLVDVSRLQSLAYIREEGDSIEVGAATAQADLLAWPQLSETVPLLKAAMVHIGHFQTRSRGTVCGSISHSDPSSELPLCLTTLGGSVVLQSKRAKRVLPAADFQVGMLTTARESDEMVVAVRFPKRKPGAGYAFTEMTQRHGDFAICGAAAIVSGDSVRLGIGGVADKPTTRDWTKLQPADMDDALNDFAWDLGGSDDQHATAAYRRELVRRLGRKVIEEAARCSN